MWRKSKNVKDVSNKNYIFGLMRYDKGEWTINNEYEFHAVAHYYVGMKIINIFKLNSFGINLLLNSTSTILQGIDTNNGHEEM